MPIDVSCRSDARSISISLSFRFLFLFCLRFSRESSSPHRIASSTVYCALKIYGSRKNKGDCRAVAGEDRESREARRHVALSKFRKKASPFSVHSAQCRGAFPRLRRRCIAHYLMDGFSLCSADSLTAGPPDCTLRPFSAAPENRGSLFRRVGAGGRGGRGRLGGGGWRRRGDEVEWKRVARGGTCSRVVA